MNSPCVQGLSQSAALQIPSCIFLYRFSFTCINILSERLQPLRVESGVVAQLFLCSPAVGSGAGGAGCA